MRCFFIIQYNIFTKYSIHVDTVFQGWLLRPWVRCHNPASHKNKINSLPSCTVGEQFDVELGWHLSYCYWGIPLGVNKNMFGNVNIYVFGHSIRWYFHPLHTLVFYAPAIRRMVEGHKVLPLSVRPCVRPSVIKIWCPLNNFWKTASIKFKFGMLIYNIKTKVEFDLGYNPLILWQSYGPFIKT